MAVSTSALIPRVRSLFNERPFASTATLTSAGDLIATVTDGNDWEEGAIMEFQDNGEQCYVQSIATNDVTVVRGWNGTTAQTHTSITVLRDPQYTYDNISKALESAVERLWPQVFKVTADTVDPDSPEATWYDLAASAYWLVSATQVYGAASDKIGIFGDGRNERQIIFKRNLPTAVVASGVGVRFPQGRFHSSNNININYATPVTGTSDIEDGDGLNMDEAVIYGAAARILTGKEGERVTMGEDVEEARSIRVGGRLSGGAYYERMFQREKEILRIRLKQKWGVMPTTKVK